MAVKFWAGLMYTSYKIHYNYFLLPLHAAGTLVSVNIALKLKVNMTLN
jgi:hypothetical protein